MDGPGKTHYKCWTCFFPHKWLDEVCLKKTSDSLEAAQDPPLSKGELMRYIGLKLLMSTMVGFSQRDFFSA